MKLCWLIPDDRGGGVSSVAVSCARQGHLAEHEVTLLLVLPPTGWIANDIGDSFILDSLNLESPAADTPAVLLGWLRDHPQDILILNGCEQADAAIPYLPSGLRVVYAVHDTARRYWQAALRYESEIDGIIAVSHAVGEKFKSRLHDPNKLKVIHNGSFFPPSPELGLARREDLLFLGGDNSAKGAYDLLRLWPRLVNKGFTGALHWMGGAEMALVVRIRALPVSARIHLYGRVPRSDVFAAAARCRILLTLTRAEAFGMTTIEAMSMGAVPVAWDVMTGTREIVREGESGFFAPLGNFEALADAVKRALVGHERLSVAAMRTARERFSEEIMWRGYAALFDEIAARSPAVRSLAGQAAPPYELPRRHFQALPAPLRRAARALVGSSPRLGYWLRDYRGL